MCGSRRLVGARRNNGEEAGSYAAEEGRLAERLEACFWLFFICLSRFAANRRCLVQMTMPHWKTAERAMMTTTMILRIMGPVGESQFFPGWHTQSTPVPSLRRIGRSLTSQGEAERIWLIRMRTQAAFRNSSVVMLHRRSRMGSSSRTWLTGWELREVWKRCTKVFSLADPSCP